MRVKFFDASLVEDEFDFMTIYTINILINDLNALSGQECPLSKTGWPNPLIFSAITGCHTLFIGLTYLVEPGFTIRSCC